MNVWLTRPRAIRCAPYDEHPVLLGIKYDRDSHILPFIGDEVFLWSGRNGGGVFGRGAIADESYVVGNGGHDPEELRLYVCLKSWDVPMSIDDLFKHNSQLIDWRRSRQSLFQLDHNDASILRTLVSGPAEENERHEDIESADDGRSPVNDESEEMKADLAQGFIRDAKVRRAIEVRAMDVAILHFRERGFDVVDTSANRPYDLECTKCDDVLRVEVKGSIGKSSRVHLTRNEVFNARSHRTVLFIVGCIEIDVQSSPPAATGGTIVRQIDNWCPSDADLVPETYTYSVPPE